MTRDANSYSAKLEEYYEELKENVETSSSTEREVESLNAMLTSCLDLPTPHREAEFLKGILRARKSYSVKRSMVAPGAAKGDSSRRTLHPVNV